VAEAEAEVPLFGILILCHNHLLQLAEAEAVAKTVTANKMAEQAALAVQDLMVAAQVVLAAAQVVLQEYAEAEVAKDGTAAHRITAAAASPGRHYIIIQLAIVVAAILQIWEGSAADQVVMAAAAVAVAGQVEARVVGLMQVTEAAAALLIVDQIKAIQAASNRVAVK